jgi:hypothetical protein
VGGVNRDRRQQGRWGRGGEERRDQREMGSGRADIYIHVGGYLIGGLRRRPEATNHDDLTAHGCELAARRHRNATPMPDTGAGQEAGRGASCPSSSIHDHGAMHVTSSGSQESLLQPSISVPRCLPPPQLAVRSRRKGRFVPSFFLQLRTCPLWGPFKSYMTSRAVQPSTLLNTVVDAGKTAAA